MVPNNAVESATGDRGTQHLTGKILQGRSYWQEWDQRLGYRSSFPEWIIALAFGTLFLLKLNKTKLQYFDVWDTVMTSYISDQPCE